MPDKVKYYVEHLHQRRESPVRGIVAATALGREASLLRKELETAHHLAPGDADNAISALTLTLWDMNVSPTQRTAAAWALGQIGGIQPVRKLLNRLEAIFIRREARVLGAIDKDIQEEVNSVRAALVEALTRAIDESTVRVLRPNDRHQLRRVCNALLNQVKVSEEIDPDLSVALAMSLAKIALRARTDIPQHTLHELLNAPEPIAILAAVGALSHLIPIEQRDQVSDERLDTAFRELEMGRGQPYSLAEKYRLLQLAGQFWYAEQDTQVAGDHLWEKIQESDLA